MPDCALKAAQLGRFWMLKVSVWPPGSEATGVKRYAVPAVTALAGTPLMVGGAAGAATVIVNAGSAVLKVPSLTLMTMFAKLPTFVPAGVPESSPVALLKLAQEGRCATAKLSALPLGSLAVGVNT